MKKLVGALYVIFHFILLGLFAYGFHLLLSNFPIFGLTLTLIFFSYITFKLIEDYLEEVGENIINKFKGDD